MLAIAPDPITQSLTLCVYACACVAWTSGTCCLQPTSVDDVGFARAIVTYMKTNYRVDSKKVCLFPCMFLGASFSFMSLKHCCLNLQPLYQTSTVFRCPLDFSIIFVFISFLNFCLHLCAGLGLRCVYCATHGAQEPCSVYSPVSAWRQI